MSGRKASIKETGEELSQDEWARFDAAVADMRAERSRTEARLPSLGGLLGLGGLHGLGGLRAMPRPTVGRPKDR